MNDFAGAMVDYGKQFVIQAIPRLQLAELGGLTPLAWFLKFLDGLGQDNIEFAINEDISLWDMLTADGEIRRLLLDASWTSLVMVFTADELAEHVAAAIVSTKPEYAKIIPKQWIRKFFESYLGSLWQSKQASGAISASQY